MDPACTMAPRGGRFYGDGPRRLVARIRLGPAALIIAGAVCMLIVGCFGSMLSATSGRGGAVAPIRTFSCEDGTIATVSGTSRDTYIRLSTGTSPRKVIAEGPIVGIRTSGSRTVASAVRLPIHLERLKLFGLLEHLTWGDRSCWR